MRGLLTLVCATFLALAFARPSEAQPRKLSDQELDKVTAGSVSPTPQTLPAAPQTAVQTFEFKSPAGARHVVEGTGTVQIVEQSGASTPRDAIVIRDHAQQNLQSFINVAAVNSVIQVLVNLNISINSTVATVNQVNGAGAGGP